jgi:hypothetical protein
MQKHKEEKECILNGNTITAGIFKKTNMKPVVVSFVHCNPIQQWNKRTKNIMRVVQLCPCYVSPLCVLRLWMGERPQDLKGSCGQHTWDIGQGPTTSRRYKIQFVKKRWFFLERLRVMKNWYRSQNLGGRFLCRSGLVKTVAGLWVRYSGGARVPMG